MHALRSWQSSAPRDISIKGSEGGRWLWSGEGCVRLQLWEREEEGFQSGRILFSKCYVENENSGRKGEEIKGFKMKQINTFKEEGSRKENGMVEELKQWFM